MLLKFTHNVLVACHTNKMLQATFPICIQHHATNTGATCWKHVEIKQFDNFQMNTSTNIMGKTKKNAPVVNYQ